MLVGLRKASARTVALIWAMVGLFALAPALSMAFATPVGAFSRSLVHSHADDEPGHNHHGHHHHHSSHHHDHGDDDHGDAGHHHEDDGNRGGSADPGQHGTHVHFEACCPSILLPVQDATARHRPSDRMVILPVEPMQGAPPDRLLRPPISVSF
jgi:hypothetical protein